MLGGMQLFVATKGDWRSAVLSCLEKKESSYTVEVLIATLGSLLTATEAVISRISNEGHDKQPGDGMADRQLPRLRKADRGPSVSMEPEEDGWKQQVG